MKRAVIARADVVVAGAGSAGATAAIAAVRDRLRAAGAVL
jgi:thioredoxin reductase